MRDLTNVAMVFVFFGMAGCSLAEPDDELGQGQRICVYDHYYSDDNEWFYWTHRCTEWSCGSLREDGYSSQSIAGVTVWDDERHDYRVELYGTCDEYRAGAELERTSYRDEQAGWSFDFVRSWAEYAPGVGVTRRYSNRSNHGEWYWELTGEQSPPTRACLDFLACYIPCNDEEDPESCFACFDELGDHTWGLTAAFDMVFCAQFECPDLCGPGADYDETMECIEQRCVGPTEACMSGDLEHDDGDAELISCSDIIGCGLACSEQAPEDTECIANCYWSGSASARLQYFKGVHIFNHSQGCVEACEDPGSECGSCLQEVATRYNLWGCLG